jgi:hypothetical protein
MPILRIVRRKQYADLLRRYRLFVGESCVACLAARESFEVHLPPGQYELLARIDWCRSNKLEVELVGEETTVVEVGSNVYGWRLFAALLFVSLLRHRYLYMQKRESGDETDGGGG